MTSWLRRLFGGKAAEPPNPWGPTVVGLVLAHAGDKDRGAALALGDLLEEMGQLPHADHVRGEEHHRKIAEGYEWSGYAELLTGNPLTPPGKSVYLPGARLRAAIAALEAAERREAALKAQEAARRARMLTEQMRLQSEVDGLVEETRRMEADARQMAEDARRIFDAFRGKL